MNETITLTTVNVDRGTLLDACAALRNAALAGPAYKYWLVATLDWYTREPVRPKVTLKVVDKLPELEGITIASAISLRNGRVLCCHAGHLGYDQWSLIHEAVEGVKEAPL